MWVDASLVEWTGLLLNSDQPFGPQVCVPFPIYLLYLLTDLLLRVGL